MNIFGRENKNYGRFLTGVRMTPDEAMIRKSSKWFRQHSLDAGVLAKLSDADIAAQGDMETDRFQSFIRSSLHQWRDTPSRSPIQILARSGIGEGDVLFSGIREQTASLVSLVQAGVLNLNRGGPIRAVVHENNKRVQISHDAVAMTLAEEGYEEFGRAIYVLQLWEMRNRARAALKMVRLPKVLYRGVRLNDVRQPERPYTGETNDIRHCRRFLAANDALVAQPLTSLSHSSILSFTQSRRVAEYFAHNEGFVIELDPRDMDVVAGWATDEILAEPEPFHDRIEKEWIVRVPSDYVLSQQQVHNRDYQFHRSFGSQQAISMLEHYDVANYTIGGYQMEAKFHYRPSGVGGSIVFTANGHYALGRQSMKKALGLDPLPSDEHPALDLQFSYRDPYLSRSHRVYPVLTEADLHLADPALAPAP